MADDSRALGRLVEPDSPDYRDYVEFVKMSATCGIKDASALMDRFLSGDGVDRGAWPQARMPVLERWCRRHAAANSAVTGVFSAIRTHVGAVMREGAQASIEVSAAMADRVRWQREYSAAAVAGLKRRCEALAAVAEETAHLNDALAAMNDAIEGGCGQDEATRVFATKLAELRGVSPAVILADIAKAGDRRDISSFPVR
jgi:hypothetical protein